MSDPQLPTFDPAPLAAVCGEDPELRSMVIGDFLSQFPSRLHHLAEAVAWGDAGRIHRAAHTLRGAAATVGAQALAAATGRLEALGHARDLEGAPNALTEVLEQAGRLRGALTAYVRDQAA